MPLDIILHWAKCVCISTEGYDAIDHEAMGASLHTRYVAQINKEGSITRTGHPGGVQKVCERLQDAPGGGEEERPDAA